MYIDHHISPFEGGWGDVTYERYKNTEKTSKNK